MLDADSDAMLSSGSVLMSSAGGSDYIMDESWLQQQQPYADERPPDTDTSPQTLPSLNHCPLDDGKNSKTACGNDTCPDDDVSRANGNADSAATCVPATESRTSRMESEKSDVGLYRQATSVSYEPFEPTAEKCIKTQNDANEQIQVSTTTENVSEKDLQELDNNVNEQQLPTADGTEADADLVNLGQASVEMQNAGVDEAGTLSVDVDSCRSSSSQSQSVEPPPETMTESSANGSEISSETVEDIKDSASTGNDSVANSDVTIKIPITDSKKNVEEQKSAAKQRIRSNNDKSSSKKETVSTKDKLDKTASSRSATNPRSTRVTVLTTSKERRSRGSVDTVQPSDKNTPEKSKVKHENDTPQSDVENKASLKSASTQKASLAAVGRRDATERSSQVKKPKNDAAANAATTQTERTVDRTEDKKSSSTATTETKRITGKRNESQKAKDREKKAADEVKETNSPANSKQESTNQTRLLGNVRTAGKGTSLSARKSSVTRSNPKPEDADKDSESQREETRPSNGKQRTKSIGLNPTVSGPVSSGTDRPAETLPEDHSTVGNPGNPKTVGDRATTSGQSKTSSAPTKKQQPQRPAGSRGVAKPTTTALPGRSASQTAKTAQRTDKPGDVAAAADSKALKSTGKQHIKQLHIPYVSV